MITPGLLASEEVEREPLLVREDLHPQPEQHLLRDPPRPREPRGAGHCRHDDEPEVRHGRRDDDGRVAGDDALVDSVLRQQRPGLQRRGLDEHEDGRHGDARPCASRAAPERERPVVEAVWGNGSSRSGTTGLVRGDLVDALLKLGGDAGERQARRRGDGALGAAAAAGLPSPKLTSLPLPRRPRRARARPARRPTALPRLIDSSGSSTGSSCSAATCARISAYRGSFASSSACVPSASTRPSSSTTTRSARLIVESRCAITRVVRSRRCRRSCSWIRCSTWTSTALVASSRTRIGAFVEQRAGERDPLPLTAGERVAALADDGVVPLGQAAR